MKTRPAAFGSLMPLSPEALASSMAEILSDAPEDGIWLFAYGSLLWSPCFRPAESSMGILQGYRRAFNIWTVHGRGTPEAPGLGLGLEPGGACRGLLLRISERTQAKDLDALWRREMFAGLYRPCWLPIQCNGAERQVLCFVTDATHPQYAGVVPAETAAKIIARADGAFGRCRDYLFDLLAALAAHDIQEPELDALAALVRKHKPD